MTEEAQQILAAAMQLDGDDRELVATILLDSIGDGESTEVAEAAWSVEIHRRLAAMRAGEMEMVPSDQVRREMHEIIERARLRKSSEAHHRLAPEDRRNVG